MTPTDIKSLAHAAYLVLQYNLRGVYCPYYLQLELEQLLEKVKQNV